MAKLTNLLALLRRRIVRQSFTGLLALLAFVLLQFGATQLAHAQLPGSDFDHASTGFVLNGQHQNVRCETCHLKGLFKGTPKTCEACHGWNNPRARFSVMPTTHIPTGNATCESCHQVNQAQFVDAARTFNHAAVRSLTCVNCHSASNPHPNVRTNPADAVHQAALTKNQGCDQCHTTIVFTGPKIPTNHIPTAAVACTACHKSADYKAMPSLTDIHAYAQAGITCAQCHGNTTTYPMTPAIVAPPGDHIAMNGQACETCHIAAVSDVQLPVVNGAKFSKSSFSHAGISSGCASCHSPNGTSVRFFGISNIIAMPSSSGFGPTSHIPTTAACEACHKPAPSGVMPANATATVPGTGFRLLKPAPAEIHANVTVACVACHEAGMSWVGVDLYTRTTTLNATTSVPYIGFQTRPNTAGGGYSLADPAHQTGGDCAVCHTTSNGFVATNLPANHIPIVATAACGTCHKTGDYSVMPSPTDIHAYAKVGVTCAQCHGNTTTYPMTPAIVAPPANHIDQGSLGCEACHIAPGSDVQLPVVNGAKFSKSSFSHTGLTKTCETCHGPNVAPGTFVGVTTIVMPPSATPGAGSHIPSTTNCESCHLGSVPSGQMAAVATATVPGSGFKIPAPTASMIHAGMTGNCASCHETNFVWLGMEQYPITTAAPYRGFQTRPQSTSGTFFVQDAAHPVGGDCVSCHSLGGAFSAPSLSANHIPVAAASACSSCHKNTDYSVIPAMGDIHANIPSTSTNCAQCHSPANAQLYSTPKMKVVSTPIGHIRDAGNVGCEGCHVGSGSSIAATPVPNGALFANSAYSHAGISSGCVTCHGPAINGNSFYGIGKIAVMPPSSVPGPNSHLPTTTNCESCHTVTPTGLIPAAATSTAPGSTGFYTLYTPTAAQIHAGAKGACSSCHETNFVWMGMDKYPIATSPMYKGFHTRPQLASSGTYFVQDANHPVTGECSNCHGSQLDFNVSVAPANHIPVGSATCASCHVTSNYAVMPTLSAIHGPGVSTTCADCHSVANALKYNAMASMQPKIVAPSANHIAMGSLGCDTCHVGAASSITALPVQDGAKFSGSLFSHSGISVGCTSCHGPSVTATTFDGVFPKTISSLSPVHLPTTAACESCHTNSVPAMLVPAAGMTTFAGAQFSHSGISSGCATCHGPDINNNTFSGVSSIVVMPATGPAGSGSHLPTSTQCESCHLGSTPSALVPGVATRTAPGSGFLLPAPTPSMIHAGVTGSCSSCHDTGMVWMSMGQYPITTVAPYKGFQTRPQSAAGTFHVADASHPVTGDCSSCHSSFSDFGAPSMPGNHIPATAACNACHKAVSYSAMPSVADIHAASPSTNCAQCHSDANAATYNTMASMVPQIVSPPGDHIDMGAAGCESCHVGTGSSIAALPVPNGAKFSGSLFNHAGMNTACSSCHGMLVGAGTFFGVTPKSMGSLSPAHIPVANSTPCETCHVNSIPTGLVPSAGMKTFAGAQFSHTNVTTTCETCHGPNITGSSFFGISKIVMMPTSAAPGAGSHLPTSTDCASCHAANTPSALVPGNATLTAPGTAFKLPAPTAAMIHAGVTGNCSSCHDTNFVWMGVDQYPITTAAPFKGFQTRPQATAGTYFVKDVPHPASGDCSSCHGGFTDFGAPSLPANHIPYAAAATCSACHGDFTALPTISKIHANAPSTSVNCAQCHSAANAGIFNRSAKRAIVTVPAKHIDMAALGCESCHVGSNSSLTLPVQDAAKFSNSAYSHVGVTTGCSTCHGASVIAGTFFGVTPKTIASLTPAHIPVSGSLGCETCHTGSIPSTLIPLAGASGAMTTFAGGKFSHSGITTGCATCHGQNVTGSTFFGVTKIVVMPPSTTPGVGSHLPTTSTCESCHLGSTPSVLVPGVATKTAPGSGFLAPTPTATMIHAGTTGTCTTCHETNMVWMGMGQYPITTTAPFKGFQTRPQNAAGTFFVKDTAHPATGNCSSCHASMNDFTATALPSNHIPVKTGVLCTACHTNADYSVMPTIANIHLYAPSSTTNCAQCHSAANADTYNTMASMNPKIKAPSATHVDMAALGCENCHITTGGVTSSMTLPVSNSAKFSNSAYSHTGVTANCASCHGATAAIAFEGVTPRPMSGLTPKHVPTTLACEVCHTSVPSALIPLSGGVAPNTFVGGQFSHSGIVNGCDTCHGAGVSASSFFGIKALVVLPPTTPAGPNAHIPSPINAQCETCHLGSTPATLVGVSTVPALGATKFKTPLPSGDMVHSGVNASCNSCHEKGYSWLGVNLYTRTSVLGASGSTYVGFQARPFSGGTAYSINDPAHPTGTADCSVCHGSTVNFRVDAKPSNHIPVQAVACTLCHTATSPLDFSATVTLANTHLYAATGSTCATCHSVTNAAKYAIPANNFSIKAPDAKHIPFGATACETCHVGSGSSMPTTTVANGAKFSGSLYSHSGVTTGCATCHGPTITGTTFAGVTSIVVAPKTSPQGLTSHIPYTAACEVCHAASKPSGLVTVTGSKPLPGSGFKLPAPTGVVIHSNSSSFSCMSCHEANYRWMGVDQYPISPTTIVANANYKGFQTRPIAAATQYSVADAAHAVGGLATGDCSQCHSGTTAFTAAGLPAGHMPLTATAAAAGCASCHSGSDYSVAGLIKTGIHAGIATGMKTYTAATVGTKTCVTCHTVGTGGSGGTAPFTGCATQAACASPPPMNFYQPMLKNAKGTHVPIGTLDCNGCHANFTAFSGMNMKPGSKVPHTNVALVGVKCMDCHELGMSWFGVTKLKVRNAGDHKSTAEKTQDCSQCHNTSGFRGMVRPIMRDALVSPNMGRIKPTSHIGKPTRGSLGNSFDHKGVAAGQCKDCHDGKRASGMPARHLMVATSCDSCHRPTTWLPAQFSHNGITAGTCLACHNGMGASNKPAGHFMTSRSCDSCHKNMSWAPVNFQHTSTLYRASPDKLTCISCHDTNGEIIRRQARALNRIKPILVGP